MNDDTDRLQQALAAADTGAEARDPLAQVKAMRQSQLAVCALRGGHEIARLQREARQAQGDPGCGEGTAGDTPVATD